MVINQEKLQEIQAHAIRISKLCECFRTDDRRLEPSRATAGKLLRESWQTIGNLYREIFGGAAPDEPVIHRHAALEYERRLAAHEARLAALEKVTPGNSSSNDQC